MFKTLLSVMHDTVLIETFCFRMIGVCRKLKKDTDLMLLRILIDYHEVTNRLKNQEMHDWWVQYFEEHFMHLFQEEGSFAVCTIANDVVG